MKIRFFAYIFLVFVPVSLRAQTPILENIFVEAIPVDSAIAANDNNLPQDAVCYRIFVDMASGSALETVTGTSKSKEWPVYPLSIETTTEFYNTATYGVDKGDAILSALLGIAPSLVYDSYVCVGGVMNNRIGVPEYLNENGYVSGTPIETITSPGLDISMFKSDNSSQAFYTEDGSWAGDPTIGLLKGPIDSSIVMIGQFITNGILKYKLNINIMDNFKNHYYCTATGPAYIPKGSGQGEPPVYQNSILSNVYGPGIEHPTITIPYVDTIVEKKKPFPLRAEAFDNDGTIDSVEFRINNQKVGVDYTAPYQINWTLLNTSTFTAIAIDNDGAVTQSQPALILAVDTGDINLIPDVKITYPENNDFLLVDSLVEVSVYTRDYFGGYVDSVYLIVDDSVIAAIDTNIVNDTIIINWTPTKNGAYKIKVKSVDNGGGVNGIKSKTDEINVSVGLAPSVSISLPLATDTIYLDDTIILVANASDEDGTITKVEFFVNNVSIGTDTVQPYEMEWVAGTVGNFSLKAIATDNDSIKATSSVVNVSVLNVSNIKEYISESKYKLYPNPTSGRINLKLILEEHIESGEIAIYNITGHKIYGRILDSELGNQTLEIEMSSFAKGIYFIQLRINDKQFNEKIIKE